MLLNCCYCPYIRTILKYVHHFANIAKEKSTRDLKRETLTKLTSKKRSHRRMPSKSNTGKIEDNTLLSIEESVGDANNPI